MPRDGFHHEIQEIEEAVILMGTLVEQQLAHASEALIRRDAHQANEVIANDIRVNDLQRTIRNQCISLMALQAPVARDLRELTTVQLVINELERMGDHASGVAKQALRVMDYEPHPIANELAEVAKIVRQQVRGSIQAFIDVNIQQARDISAVDDEIDYRYRRIFTDLLTSMTSDPTSVPCATSLLFIAHDLERIGDRVTNICEDIVYMVSGEIEELN